MELGKSQNHMDSSEVVWNFREKKSIQGTRANCSSWKVQRSLKFVFQISSLSSRSKVLVFVWLIQGAARWPHTAGGLCFMSLPYLLFSLGVLTSYLLCCLILATQCSMGRKGKLWLGVCSGCLQILSDQIVRLTMFFSFIHQRLRNIFQKKMVPKNHCGVSRNPGFEMPWLKSLLPS